ncbi:MAG: replication-associated recombination protein A [Flavobacteriaceae bacterium]|nr:replication-associated recombination protein A [Flavobacteriaceae bacterium]
METIPLAQRVRPQTIDEFIGQDHLVGPEGALRIFLDQSMLRSMLFWGPPGTGKTALGEILSKNTSRPFVKISAIHTSVKQVRQILDHSKQQPSSDKRTILFVDEIHRFNKAQQDCLLEGVESGIITLIGATTENPGFEVINALLSRCLVFIFNPLTDKELKGILVQAIENDHVLNQRTIHLVQTDALFFSAGGDARKMLGIFEMIILSSNQNESVSITDKLVLNTLQSQGHLLDKKGDKYYHSISALIKSIRGSDPNAGLYWLACLIEGGQDPIYIARRLIILAAEDIGLANPNSLLLANATFDSVQKIGLPEAKIILSQCVIYLSVSPKSNSAYKAIKNAEKLIKKNPNLLVPLHLRNASTRLDKSLGAGLNYMYAHDYPDGFVTQNYLPEKISGALLYHPADNNHERKFRERLKKLWSNLYKY